MAQDRFAKDARGVLSRTADKLSINLDVGFVQDYALYMNSVIYMGTKTVCVQIQ